MPKAKPKPPTPTSSTLRAWVQAARPLAQGNIAPPLLFGAALAYAEHGRFSWTLLAWAHAFGLLDQLFIVFANDVVDHHGDSINRVVTPFSGGSRVLPEAKIRPAQLAGAAVAAAAALGALSLAAAWYAERPFMVVCASMAVFLLWAYSFGPFRLSYRGHGEVLQALGLGLVLPLVGYYLQSDDITPPWRALMPAFVLGYAGNLTTAVPDVDADTRVNKRTFAVRHGERAARRTSQVLIAIAACGAGLVRPGLGLGQTALLATPALLLIGANALRRRVADPRAEATRFVTLNGAAITLTLVGWTLALFTHSPA